jgi:hypothetical protein
MAVPEVLLRATVDLRVMADLAGPRATAVAAAQVAADTIRRRVVVEDITPEEEAVATPVAEVVDTPAVAVIPAAADMAEAIAKKLGDATSLREAAT